MKGALELLVLLAQVLLSLLEALHRNAVLSSTAIRAVSVEGLLLDCSLCNSS